jgi:hypothetical protein
MSKIPPLLPVETVRRLLRVAHADGTSVLVVAGISALMAASSGDKLDALLLLLVCGAGALELHGANLIGSGIRTGIRWLIGSQLFLLTVMLGYVGIHVMHLPVPAFSSIVPDDVMQQAASQQHVSTPEFAELFDSAIAFSIVLLTLVYQGWMIIYYSRRRQALNTFFGTL